MEAVIGIDPGNSGGIAVLDNSGALIVQTYTKDGNSKLSIDGKSLSDILRRHPGAVVYIEEVGLRHRTKQRVVSAFTFGAGFGVIHRVCETLGLNYDQFIPQDWQSFFNLNTAQRT